MYRSKKLFSIALLTTLLWSASPSRCSDKNTAHTIIFGTASALSALTTIKFAKDFITTEMLGISFLTDGKKFTSNLAPILIATGLLMGAAAAGSGWLTSFFWKRFKKTIDKSKKDQKENLEILEKKEEAA